MKVFILSFIVLFLSISSNAQVTSISDLELGFNIGGSCINGDVQRVKSSDSTNLKSGFGIGLTMDYYFLKEKAIGLALRSRYLFAKTRGQAVQPLYNIENYSNFQLAYPLQAYIYPNFEQEYHEGSLELLLTANQLRKNTGIVIHGMAGLGYHSSITNTDLYNSLGIAHNYAGIDSNWTNTDIATEAALLLDQNYESYAANNKSKIVNWNPTLGFGIGYDFGPVSLMYEHKASFLRNDFIDGVQGSNLLFNRDILHYNAAGIYFKLGYNNEMEFTYDDPIENTNTSTVKPSVDITGPAVDPYRTSNPNLNVSAKTKHIKGKSEITVWINGVSKTNFSFSNGTIQIPTGLRLGENLVRVKVENNMGEDTDQMTLILEKSETQIILPKVNFTTPAQTPSETRSFEESLVAKASGIASRQNVNILVNQVPFSAFEFNEQTQMIFLIAPLRAGRNEIKVAVYNNFGSAEDTQIINVTGPKPIVKITSPSPNNAITTSSSMEVIASIHNVDQRENLNIRVNGRIISNFNYLISQNKLSFNAHLVNGENLVEIQGSNIYGTDKDVFIIIRKRTQTTCNGPEITFINPNRNITTQDGSYSLKAKIKEVSSTSQILVKINGRTINNFSFDSRTNGVSLKPSLVEGSNSISIQAENDCDDAYAVIKITRESEEESDHNSRRETNDDSNSEEEENTLNDNRRRNGSTREEVIEEFVEEELDDNRRRNTGGFEEAEEEEEDVIEDSRNRGPNTENNNCTTPVITVERPYSNESYHNNNPFDYEAIIQNVSKKSDITFNVDGEPFDFFDYNISTKKLTVTFPLSKGGSTIEIIANGNCGDEVSNSHYVTFLPDDGNSSMPRLGNISPGNDATVQANVQIRAQLINIIDADKIQIFVNGEAVRDFQFQTQRQMVTANLAMRMGNNTIKIKAYNNNGIIVKEMTYKRD
jgi:hypothetical protein